MKSMGMLLTTASSPKKTMDAMQDIDRAARAPNKSANLPNGTNLYQMPFLVG